MDNQQGRTVGPDFIAGLVVGEGSFLLAAHKVRGGKLRIKPQFYMQMNDGETMQIVYRSLKEAGIGAHLHHRPNRGCWTLQVAGFQRMRSLINYLGPWLTGQKKKAADVVYLYIKGRLDLPPSAPYTDEDVEFVKELRAINGNQRGRKNPL